MNRKIIGIDVDISKFIIKAPRETARSSPNAREYISEIWYKDDDDKIYVPVLQPPRLRVKYGAKRYNPQSSFGYCVSMYNCDIDPEIEAFYNFVKLFDKYTVQVYTDKKSAWGLQGIKNKYWTAMRRKSNTDDFYFAVKLIHGKEGEVLTSINNSKRNSCKPTDITYGIYIDQYISPAFVIYNTDGIHPVWNAHQVVISELERVFLGNCLLDQISEMPTPMPPFVPPPPPLATVLPPPGTSRLPTAAAGPALSSLVNQSDLENAIKKLKKTSLGPKPPIGHLNLITPEDLQRRKDEMARNAHSKIMHESIKDVPVEGGIVVPKRRIRKIIPKPALS
jgi:hypothetical protein